MMSPTKSPQITRAPGHSPRGHRGFTVIELLVVIGIVMILLSLVIVGVNRATRAAQSSNTAALMGSIKQGLVQFREDMGYLPPVLDTERNLRFEFTGGPSGDWLNGPDPRWGSSDWSEDTYRLSIQQWYSVTTLADYLIGYGGVDEDGRDGLGIRNPGTDGYWNVGSHAGTPGLFTGRTDYLDEGNAASDRFRRGTVYGPYLQLRDDRLLGRLIGTEPDENGSWDVAFPGESRYDAPEFVERPLVICDYWGQPIHYYRLPYPAGLPGDRYRRPSGATADEFHQPSLADAFVMRPYNISSDNQLPTRFPDEFAPGGDVDPEFADGDRTSSRRLQGATFGLLSAGRNRQIDYDVRSGNRNRTNIVEFGQ